MPEQSELQSTDWRTELDEYDNELLREALVEVERYREMDRLVPSPHNLVTVAILEVSPTSLGPGFVAHINIVEPHDDGGKRAAR